MSCKYNGGKILVLGCCDISAKVIKKMLLSYGMVLKDFEFIPYDKVNKFDFGKLLGSTKYSHIFIGATPHKAQKLAGSSSPHQFLLDNESELPSIQQLRQKEGALGISKVNFEEAIIRSAKFRKETYWQYENGLLA